MSTLFDEAIAEAKQLRQLAEENAKKKILDAMAPRIRRLIEQELVDDLGDETLETSDLDSLLPPPDDFPDGDQPDVDINIAGDATIALTSAPVDFAGEDEDVHIEDELMSLSKESAVALAALLKDPRTLHRNSLLERVDRFGDHVIKFKRLLEWVDIDESDPTLRESARKHYTQLLKEAISLRDHVIFTKRTNKNKNVRSRFNMIIREMGTMSRRHTETLFDRLFERKQRQRRGLLWEQDVEAAAVEDVAVEDLEVDDAPAAEGPGLVLDPGEVAALVDAQSEEEVLAALEAMPVETGFTGEVEAEVGEEEVEFDLEEMELLLPEPDPDEDAGDYVDALPTLDVSMGGEEVEVEDEEEEVELGEVYEIDESVLRRELRRMRRLREQEEAKDADPYLDHGGEDLGDSFVDVDEDTLLNALADELGDPGVPTPTVESRRRAARRRRVVESRSRNPRASRARVARVNESRKNRALKKRLVEYHNAFNSLRGQLTEMNLFNAKLLYVNKLMQNRDLSSKQQRAIVEALDNAKTLREAKLLYKSLTSSLNRRRGLTEGRAARTLGSSSRSTRSASPSKNGVEVDRWAVLAGINK